MVHPSKRSITLATDLAGLTTALYDPDEKDLQRALRPASDAIRQAVRRAFTKDAE